MECQLNVRANTIVLSKASRYGLSKVQIHYKYLYNYTIITETRNVFKLVVSKRQEGT